MKTTPCPMCGSTSPRGIEGGAGLCANVKGCNARRCARRQREDDQSAVRDQCHATMRGVRSIRFCTLRQGHQGMHLNGTREWAGNRAHPFAVAFRAARAS